ncbi:MAG: L,D-transpeptidase family protein [Acidimicrobiales bacterium]
MSQTTTRTPGVAPDEPPWSHTAGFLRPANGATNVAGTSPIQVTFSSALSSTTPDPTVSPAVPGTWVRSGTRSLTFTPTGAFLPYTPVRVTVPGGASGEHGRGGALLAQPVVDQFAVTPGSPLRLQQLLSLLGYSPLAWTPAGAPIGPTDVAAQERAVFAPPQGTFTWRQNGWPAGLTALWQPGSDNVFTDGLVMEFQADHALNVDGTTDLGLWNDLIHALAASQTNTGGYNYALASKVLPESLTIWHDGQIVFHSLTNTGIPKRPTNDGTFPVYTRYRNQVMHGTNPNGSPYADPVQFVAYFHRGDAVHYIPRASYRFPQSLGCVELPLAAAAQAWPYLAYGTLVTVTG